MLAKGAIYLKKAAHVLNLDLISNSYDYGQKTHLLECLILTLVNFPAHQLADSLNDTLYADT